MPKFYIALYNSVDYSEVSKEEAEKLDKNFDRHFADAVSNHKNAVPFFGEHSAYCIGHHRTLDIRF